MVSPTRIPRILLLATGLLFPGCLFGQTPTNSKLAGGDEKLANQVQSLSESIRQARLELSESYAEIRELKAVVEQMRSQLSELAQATSAATRQAIERRAEEARAGESGAEEDHRAVSAQAPADGTHPALISEDDWELLNAKVEEQHQDKVESGSKFRLKLSGLLLMNALSTSGQVDNLDLANVALPSTQTASHGSTAASLRQSIIGLTGTGPTLAGANTAADLQFDFFGGLPAGYGSDGSGIARIRLARMRFDWESRSVVGGLDTPFFSPNSPTTYVSVAEPGFSTAGNLWVWSPSLRLEQRFSVYRSQVKLEGGFLDPVGYAVTGENYRVATPGESSRQPAYAIRVSANRGESDHALSVGVAGVYTPQRFAGGDSVNGGAAMLDWRVPIKAHLELSGEFFDGKGIEAFGGVAPGLPPQNQYQYSATSAYTLGGIRMLGGWSQLKLRVDARNEFNAAAGYGGWVSSALRSAAATDVNLSSIPARNQMFFFNYILRPKSDLLFSLEYRRLRTFEASGAPATADQVGLAAGFLF